MDYIAAERATDDEADRQRRAAPPLWASRGFYSVNDELEYGCHWCAACGYPLTEVRPGKYQCDRCEDERLSFGGTYDTSAFPPHDRNGCALAQFGKGDVERMIERHHSWLCRNGRGCEIIFEIRRRIRRALERR